MPDATRGAQMSADKPSPPPVEGEPVGGARASVPLGTAEFSSEFSSASFNAGADDVTVTCTIEGTVTAHAKRRAPPHSPAQQQASATARAAGTVRPAAATAAIATAAPRMCIPLSPAPCE